MRDGTSPEPRDLGSRNTAYRYGGFYPRSRTESDSAALFSRLIVGRFLSIHAPARGPNRPKLRKPRRQKFPSCSLAQPIRSGLGWRGRHGARSTWTIRDRSDAIDRRHVTAQESARRSGASSIIPPPSGRIGAALSRLIVAGRRACMWSAMAAPGRSAPARQSVGCRSQSGEPPRPCARAEATIS